MGKYSVKKNNKSRLRFVPAIVFTAFVLGMAVWFVFSPKSGYSSSEKRYLQQFPEATGEKVLSGEFGEEFETFFADQFPARNFWVGFNAYYNLMLGNNGEAGIYNCKNGYLINKPVSTENNLKKNTGAIVDFKSRVNVPVTVMFAPSTGYIASDVLPAIHDEYNDDMYFNNASRLFSENGIEFVDLRERFLDEYKNGTQLYYRTDHHWTTAGAYTAYTELCESLKLKPVSKASLEVKSFDGFYGTTYSSSGYWLTPADSIEIWSNPKNTSKNIHVKITEGSKTEEYGSMYFESHLSEDDKYPVFIDGNHALTEITNTNAPSGTLVMVKDSFSHSLAPFIAENYSKVILVDMRYYKQSVSDIVKNEKADRVVVLYGIDNIATDTDLVWLQ